MISHPQEYSDPVSPATTPAAQASPQRRSPALVLGAWTVVALPALWGIYMTVMTGVQLFHPTAPGPAPAAAAATK